MKNVWKELEPLLEGMEFLEATLAYDEDYTDYKVNQITVNNVEDLKSWAENINYDNGYGAQKLFGTVYLRDKDGDPVWLTRGKYDGSEWWEINRIPQFYK